jgi:Zn-dependent peptidase ImmA (M78 family)
MAIKVSKGIAALAEHIASQYEEPVPLEQVAKNELIEVIYDNYGKPSFDGITWFEPETDNFYIHLNTAQCNFSKNTKGRFTLAHELGHYYIPSHRLGLMNGTLKPHGSVNYLSNQIAWQIERDADAFASSLLMPESSLNTFIKGRRFNFGVIEAIANKYRVSKSAAAIRFANIGNCPIMVVFAERGRIKWAIHSSDFPFFRLRYGNGRGDKVPEYSVIGDYFFKNINNGYSEEIVNAGDCFDIRYEEDNNRKFIEWCMPFNNIALSVFWEA